MSRHLDLDGSRAMEGPLRLVGNAVNPLEAVPLQQLGGLSGWAAYTPVITAGSGTFTAVSATGRWAQINKVVFFTITITITTNGTAAADIIATLPTTANSLGVVAGRANAISGKMLHGLVNGGSVLIVNYDNSYPGASGEAIFLSGSYETQ